MRDVELLALAPDVFDISYYTIMPQYTSTIANQLRLNRALLGIPNYVAIAGDFSRQAGPLEDNTSFNVKDRSSVSFFI
ncbi:MAG: hypothetical protein R2827_01145 [Bdellovibrionales bacterium]